MLGKIILKAKMEISKLLKLRPGIVDKLANQLQDDARNENSRGKIMWGDNAANEWTWYTSYVKSWAHFTRSVTATATEEGKFQAVDELYKQSIKRSEEQLGANIERDGMATNWQCVFHRLV